MAVPVPLLTASCTCSNLSSTEPSSFATTLVDANALFALSAPTAPRIETALSVTVTPSVPSAVTIFALPSSSKPEPVAASVMFSAFMMALNLSIMAPSLFPVRLVMFASVDESTTSASHRSVEPSSSNSPEAAIPTLSAACSDSSRSRTAPSTSAPISAESNPDTIVSTNAPKLFPSLHVSKSTCTSSEAAEPTE